MRAFKTIMAIICGAAAFFFLVMLAQPGAGQVPSIVLFVVCALLTVAFARKTPADREQIAKQRQKTATWVDAVSDTMASQEPRQAGDPLKRTLVGATVLHVLAFPFLVLRDLLKMQK